MLIRQLLEDLLPDYQMEFIDDTVIRFDDYVRPEFKEWFRKRFRQYLIGLGREYLETVISDGSERNGFIDDMDQIVNSVSDWLASLPETNPRLIPKLFKVTWSQAVDASLKWHEQLERQANDPKRRKNIKGGDDVRTIMEFPDGMRWVDLLTPESRDYEGRLMGHCVGEGNYDYKRILSLRDGKNEPHCTIEIAEDGGIWEQVKGKGNKEIVERYRPYVIALANEMRPKEIRDSKNFGCIFINGILYEYNNLPDALTVNGDLYFSGLTGLTRLPNGLTIHGSLYISNCNRLTRLPDGLTIHGGLNVFDCTEITGIPDILTVDGDILFNNCTKLNTLSDGLTVVHGKLRISKCTGLTKLPDGLTIKGDLILFKCTGLTKLPNGLTVHGNLHLNDCIGLTKLPNGLIVDKIINLDGCINLKRIPKHLVSKCRNIPEHLKDF